MTTEFDPHARIVCWFSCGAASAVAAKLAIDKYHSVVLVYCDTSESEHPDNMRFLHDCERWFGSKITIIKSTRYDNVDDVFKQTRYMSGIAGARCTIEMKKVPRFAFQQLNDTHIFGYHLGEERRARQLAKTNFELRFEWPLIDKGLTKEDCKTIIEQAGIDLPVMYGLGFKNNNCLGCVKATSPQYWNQIRRLFPEVFASRAARSREIGCRLTRVKIGKNWRRIFLDQLLPNDNTILKEDLSCGPLCSVGLDEKMGEETP